MSAVALVHLLGGLALLIAGAELLVRGASQLARRLGLSPLVIGLTVVAFGTSAPELAVSLRAALAGSPDVAVGNVLGSNIFNVLVILGLGAVAAPLVVAEKLVRRDVPAMIGASVLLLLLALDGRLGRLDGAVLAGLFVAFTALMVRHGRRDARADAARRAAGGDPAAGPRSAAAAPWPLAVALVVAGLVLLVVGARWLVDGAVAAAVALGLGELIIALTIVAAGTSLPELATSVVAALRGERDLAVGNVVGSNLFNVLAILGTAALAAPAGIAVAAPALRFDLPVMIAASAACLPIFFTGYRISRWEGALFLACYAAYVLYLVLAASRHAALPAYSAVMGWFVLPLTAVTLAVVAVRQIRRKA